MSLLNPAYHDGSQSQDSSAPNPDLTDYKTLMESVSKSLRDIKEEIDSDDSSDNIPVCSKSDLLPPSLLEDVRACVDFSWTQDEAFSSYDWSEDVRACSSIEWSDIE